MGIGATAFAEDRNRITGQSDSLALNPQLVMDADSTSNVLRNADNVPAQESPEMRQLTQTAKEMTSVLFGGFLRDTSKDGPEAQREELVEELQRTAPKPGPAVLTLG